MKKDGESLYTYEILMHFFWNATSDWIKSKICDSIVENCLTSLIISHFVG